MVCLLGFMAVAAATIGANAFTQPCHYPYDHCGWVLASRDYGEFPSAAVPFPMGGFLANMFK